MESILDQLVDRVYEASILPELWPVLLHDLSAYIGGAGGCLFLSSPTGLSWISTESFRPVMEAFGDFPYEHNARLQGAVALRCPGFVSDGEFLTREEMDCSPFYQDFMRPLGWGWAAGTVIEVPNGDMLVLNLERKLEQGPVERGFLPALDTLHPHLTRAAILMARRAREQAVAGIQFLATLGLPAAILNGSARVLASNTLFNELPRQLTIGAFDRLSLGDARCDGLLRSALAEIQVGKTHGTLRSIGVPAVDTDPAAVLHLIPIRGATRELFSFGSAILVATPVTAPTAPDASVLAALFDLTPSESKLAQALVGGHDLTSAAQAHGVSRETSKTHLKAVLTKTGTRRQAELVGLLAGIARR